ncbi:hypothetical protein GCM10011609_28920 [Lentzea pudingi]|uniref:Recombinase domain-containing protein n=1 Tax=Lentzea pudingi TaxID=1789439 RepID=A0ABQ2HVK7_9PSEU|nr:hypothetical protein GCM10011609_28920 [Lentzea pudingi]
MILENPRYTGRQVWNRSSTTGHGRAGGRGSGALRRNPVNGWEVSERIAHDPLVDDETFVAVQGMRVAKPAKDGEFGAIGWLGSSCVGCVAGGWTGTGFMGERATDADTALPAPSDVPTANHGTSTSEKTACSRHCHTYSGGPLDPWRKARVRSWSITSASSVCRFIMTTGVVKFAPAPTNAENCGTCSSPNSASARVGGVC